MNLMNKLKKNKKQKEREKEETKGTHTYSHTRTQSSPYPHTYPPHTHTHSHTQFSSYPHTRYTDTHKNKAQQRMKRPFPIFGPNYKKALPVTCDNSLQQNPITTNTRRHKTIKQTKLTAKKKKRGDGGNEANVAGKFTVIDRSKVREGGGRRQLMGRNHSDEIKPFSCGLLPLILFRETTLKMFIVYKFLTSRQGSLQNYW